MHLLLIVVNVLYIIYDFTFIYLFSVFLFLFLFLGEISYTATLVNPKKMKETPQVLTGSLLTQRQEAAETSNSSVM